MTNPLWNWLTSDESPPSKERNPRLSAVEFNRDYFTWGLTDLPVKAATEHLLSCGAVGSGKTTGIRLFLQSIAPRFQAGHPDPEQLIIFDAKGDALPILDGLGINPDSTDVWILNPFDERGTSWDLGSAIHSPAMARYFSNLIIPHESKSTAPYFNNAARQIVCWTSIALNQVKPGAWDLRDLINALESKERMLSVCRRFPRAEAAVSQHCNDSTNFGGVMSTLETKIGELHEVAALWDTSKSQRKFSVTDFLKKRGVLILGYDPVLEKSIVPMNAIILKALTNAILRQPETRVPRHWFVLDEFHALKQVDCIRNLLNLGRSKGASVLLGIQSIEGLREIYGPDATEDILQACSSKTFLKVGGVVTPEWAEKYFGRIRQTERSTGISHGPRGSTTYSENFHVQERALFLAAMFSGLPKPKPGGVFCAINDLTCYDQILINDWWADDVFAMCKPLGNVSGIIARQKTEDQFLRPWTAKEERDLCDTTSPGTPLAEESPTSPTTKEAHKKRRYPK